MPSTLYPSQEKLLLRLSEHPHQPEEVLIAQETRARLHYRYLNGEVVPVHLHTTATTIKARYQTKSKRCDCCSNVQPGAIFWLVATYHGPELKHCVIEWRYGNEGPKTSSSQMSFASALKSLDAKIVRANLIAGTTPAPPRDAFIRTTS